MYEDYIQHSGIAHDENPPGRGSGRYPFGQGDRPHQHDWDLKARIAKYQADGLSEKEIAKSLGLTSLSIKSGEQEGSVSRLRAEKEVATANVKADMLAEVQWYYNNINPNTGKNYSRSEVARILGKNESSLRSLEASKSAQETSPIFKAADSLRSAVSKKGYIDIGSGVELELGVSSDRLNTVTELLKKEGYRVETIRIKQLQKNDGSETIMKVLCPPDSEPAYKNWSKVQMFSDVDGTSSAAVLKGVSNPVKIGLNRVYIRYDEEGGTEKDGIIEIRAKVDKNGNYIPASEDLSIGNARYAQVRIAVDGGQYGSKYIKGMAVYSTDVPDGYDILVNSNKSVKKGVDGALKDMKEGVSNPFGATTVQTQYTESKTGAKKQSAINIVGSNLNDAHVEGAWSNWSRNLPSQFLSKQSLTLVKQQLKLKVKESESELSDIENLNNSTVKKKMLIDFADGCDAAAVDLKAASLAGQSQHVIIASKTLKNNEVYAPNFANGTTVVLVRFPHAGSFEIPTLKVNNKNVECINTIGKNAKDAIMINHNVAAKLSGADFDGDSVAVIPLTKKGADGNFSKIVSIKSTESLPGLVGFDPTSEYSKDNSRFKNSTWKPMNSRTKGIEMGVASNLITDMYAKGCDNTDHITRAVKYSMVVIDAQKHNLNYKQAAKDLGIEELKSIYQSNAGTDKHGASSLLSRSKSQEIIDKRAMWQGDIDPDTGEKIYRTPKKTEKEVRSTVSVSAPDGYKWTDESGKTHRSTVMKNADGSKVEATYGGKVKKDKSGNYYYDTGTDKKISVTDSSTGKTFVVSENKVKWVTTGTAKITQKSTKMAETNDARTLLSDNPSAIEIAYASYANHMKSLGNMARKLSLLETGITKDSTAAKTYEKEVASLQEKLTIAKTNSPKERAALRIATSRIQAQKEKNPNMEAEDLKKAKAAAMNQARIETGASKTKVTFTEKEWDAINKGAISNTLLEELLDNADDSYKKLATPKTSKLSSSKQSLIKMLYASGFSYEEIADRVGVSTSAISSYV